MFLSIDILFLFIDVSWWGLLSSEVVEADHVVFHTE